MVNTTTTTTTTVNYLRSANNNFNLKINGRRKGIKSYHQITHSHCCFSSVSDSMAEWERGKPVQEKFLIIQLSPQQQSRVLVHYPIKRIQTMIHNLTSIYIEYLYIYIYISTL